MNEENTPKTVWHKWVPVFVCAVLVLAGILVVTLPKSKSASPQSHLSSAPVTTTTGPNLTPTQTWTYNNAGAFGTLGSDLQAIGTATSSSSVVNGDFSGVIDACQQLQADVTTDQALPQIPDQQAQSDWSSLLYELSSAATNCVQGAENNSPSLIESATQQFNQADTYVAALKTDLGF